MLSFITVVALGLAAVQQPQDTPLPFGDSRWELQGERTAIVKDGGRDVLQVETGFAHRRDVRFQDGTIDFDVQVSRRRSFVYVYFRAESDGEREEFYLRPHKSALPDALQYAPVWQGRSAWQLYHGPGGTAAVAFEPGVWTHVRIVVQGVRVASSSATWTRRCWSCRNLPAIPSQGSSPLAGSFQRTRPGAVLPPALRTS